MARRAFAVQGIVQGVGFRPFVHRLASRLKLGGFVKNKAGGVWIEVEGDAGSIDRFLTALRAEAPSRARIESLESEWRPSLGESGFRIEPSEIVDRDGIFAPPDVATCDECLAELFDPGNRRFGYPFLNCVHCGPRLTIITGFPYDRERTTMVGFPMCVDCRAEYEDPANRRFHAEASACSACGPRLRLLNARGEPLETDRPLEEFVEALDGGRIGALKGLGGYHLACDATNATAVGELRLRKGRDDKPFALMVKDAIAARALCEMSAEEEALLRSPARPIVLLRAKSSIPIADAVAGLSPELGLFLPYTPIHHLLLRATRDKPLVMTSGNRANEPIVFDDSSAVDRLGGIADLFLTHDRPIRVRCDDSVSRIVDGLESPVRRSRGYAPLPIALPFDCPRPILALGGQLKAAFVLGRGRHAFVGHHLGDLDHFEAYRAFERDIELYQDLFAFRPERIVHDEHPDYASTRYARDRAVREGISLAAVQHHQAHIAGCMAEHGLNEPVIGVAFDGTGYGTDGAIWGGEFFEGDYARFRRAAHFRYVAMPGSEQAVREPWRMAAAHLADAGCALSFPNQRIPPSLLKAIAKMLERKINSPLTSSAGRLFDAVASLIGVRDRATYEGQAAIELEWLAVGRKADGIYPFEIETRAPTEDVEATYLIDTRPLIREIRREVDRSTSPEKIAGRFHATMVEMIVVVCERLRDKSGLETVVLGGGVFLNALLSREVGKRLSEKGFRTYRPRLLPPNDGGLGLGQLAIASRISTDPSPILDHRT